MSRPLSGTGPRKPVHTTVAPETVRAIADERRRGESIGQVIDRALEALRQSHP